MINIYKISITNEQIQELINVLAEIPAKHSYNAIFMLQNLPNVEKERQANIRNDIANTLIDFNGGKFKIRKKDFAPIIAQFMDIKEYDTVPVNVLDYYYTPIPFTYQDFLDFKTLVSATQTAILIENS